MSSINESCNATSPVSNGVAMAAALQSVLTDLTALKTEFNLLRASFAGHVHGGVTAGAANTSAVAATTSAAVTLVTTS